MSNLNRILIATAVAAEKDAVLSGVAGDTRFTVREVGVGPIAAGVNTALHLAHNQYDLVISAGIGGGFPGKAELAALVVADRIIVADLGAETPDGFWSVDKLGFGSSDVPVETALVQRVSVALQQAALPTTVGPVLTVSTVTGSAATAEAMAARVSGAVAEAMEGYGVALAAHNCGIPVLEIRVISNAVGPRDRAAWRIKEALARLTEACKVLSEVL